MHETKNRRVAAAIAARDKAQAKYNTVMFEEACKCKHTRIVFARSENASYVRHEEMRCCLDCGLCELEHHWGFKVLTHEFRKEVEREEIYRLRKGQFTSEVLRPLHAGEITVREAVARTYKVSLTPAKVAPPEGRASPAAG